MEIVAENYASWYSSALPKKKTTNNLNHFFANFVPSKHKDSSEFDEGPSNGKKVQILKKERKGCEKTTSMAKAH